MIGARDVLIGNSGDLNGISAQILGFVSSGKSSSVSILPSCQEYVTRNVLVSELSTATFPQEVPTKIFLSAARMVLISAPLSVPWNNSIGTRSHERKYNTVLVHTVWHYLTYVTY